LYRVMPKGYLGRKITKKNRWKVASEKPNSQSIVLNPTIGGDQKRTKKGGIKKEDPIEREEKNNTLPFPRGQQGRVGKGMERPCV